jgi:hypothetical protein
VQQDATVLFVTSPDGGPSHSTFIFAHCLNRPHKRTTRTLLDAGHSLGSPGFNYVNIRKKSVGYFPTLPVARLYMSSHDTAMNWKGSGRNQQSSRNIPEVTEENQDEEPEYLAPRTRFELATSRTESRELPLCPPARGLYERSYIGGGGGGGGSHCYRFWSRYEPP